MKKISLFIFFQFVKNDYRLWITLRLSKYKTIVSLKCQLDTFNKYTKTKYFYSFNTTKIWLLNTKFFQERTHGT
jgi:hypothetical protein